MKNVLVKIKKSKQILRVYKSIFQAVTYFPRNKKLIIFESFNGRQYSDNPRAIYEYMKEHNTDYRMVWSIDKNHLKQFDEKDIEYAKRFSFKWLWCMATAKYWVTNSRFPLWFRKSKNTVYLQTWHGTPLKKLGVDIRDVHMPDTTTDSYKENFLKESNKWDYLISPNEYSTNIFRRAFGYDGKMLETGYPRNDFLINSNNEKTKLKIKEKLGIEKGKKVILYAPTWRDNEYYDKGKYKFDIKMDLEKMKKSMGNEYVVLLRLHYLVSENIELSQFSGFAYDCSKYEDIRDLYIIADTLITDYSSVFFDFGLLNKPMLFYVYDIESYRDQLRGFYYDFEHKAPGKLLKTTDELILEIQDIEENGYQETENLREFTNTFSLWENGRATENIVNEVFNKSKGD